MANQEGEEDQFQADLAKALALSLETHAMESLRREGNVYVNVSQGMYYKTLVQYSFQTRNVRNVRYIEGMKYY